MQGGRSGKFPRHCPRCRILVVYTDYFSRERAILAKAICRSCRGVENGRKNKGKKRSDELKRHFSETRRGVNNSFYGKRHSLTTKKRLSERRTGQKHSVAAKKKISKAVAGVNNPRFGKSLFSIWEKKYGTEEAEKREALWKQRTSVKAKGKNNPMYGKPSPTGSGNGWSGWYKGWYFRSLLELSYVIRVIEKNNWSWISAESSRFTICWTDYAGAPRTYRPDFFVNGSILVEVKPTSLHNSSSVRRKKRAAVAFCEQNGMTYQLVDCQRLGFVAIRKLWRLGVIRFLPRYEKRFKCLLV